MSFALSLLSSALVGCAPMDFCPDGGRCVSFEEYCAELGTAAGCRRARSCGVVPASTDCGSGVNACSATLRETLASGALRFDSPKAGACLTGTDCAACAAVFKSTTEQGCRTHEACGSASFCDLRERCPGRCLPKLGVGSDVLTLRGCASGAAVMAATDRYRCVSPASEGQPCEPSTLGNACAPGTACAAVDGGFRCVMQAAPGGACAGPASCPVDHHCELGRCVRQALATEPCGDGGSVCVPSLSCVAGRCAALGVGTACDVATAACVPSAFCASPSLVCTARVEVGVACNAPQQCVAGAACTAGLCTALRQPSESCDETKPCDVGLRCEEGSCRAPGCWAP